MMPELPHTTFSAAWSLFDPLVEPWGVEQTSPHCVPWEKEEEEEEAVPVCHMGCVSQLLYWF